MAVARQKFTVAREIFAAKIWHNKAFSRPSVCFTLLCHMDFLFELESYMSEENVTTFHLSPNLGPQPLWAAKKGEF